MLTILTFMGLTRSELTVQTTVLELEYKKLFFTAFIGREQANYTLKNLLEQNFQG